MSESSYIFEATEENFQQGVIENSFRVPVVVDFWAEWCQPCKILIPILEKLVDDMQGQCVLAKVNSETQQALSQQFQIRSIPTVLIFKNGEMVEQFTGVQPEERIRELISKHITTEADILRNQAIEQIQSGDFDAGQAKLLEAEKLDPDNATVQIDLAHIEANKKEYSQARERLQKLKLSDRERPEVVSLLNKIELAEVTENAPPLEQLQANLESNPDDSLSRYQLATQLIHQEEYQQGLEQLLQLLQKDRAFQDNAAQKTLISTFTLLGDEHPLVGQYRRKMFNILH